MRSVYTPCYSRWFLWLIILLTLSFAISFISTAAEEAKEDRGIVIRNNVLSDSGFGIYVGSRGDEVFIENNVIRENAEAVRLMGIRRHSLVRYNDIKDNLVGITLRDMYSDNVEGYVKRPLNLEDVVISGNNFLNNEDGNILDLLTEGEEEEEEGSTEETTSTNLGDEETSSSGESNVDQPGKEDTAGNTSKEPTSEGPSNEINEGDDTSENEGSEDSQQLIEDPSEGSVEEETAGETAEESPGEVSSPGSPGPDDREERGDESSNETAENVTASGSSGLGDYAWLIGGVSVVGLTALLLLIKG